MRRSSARFVLASSLLLAACSSSGGGATPDGAGGDGAGGVVGGDGGLDAAAGADATTTDASDADVSTADTSDADADVITSGDASFDGGLVATLTIPATANLWGAGHAVPPDPSGHGAGVLPVRVDLPPGTARTMTITNVSGSIDFDGPATDLLGNDADGFMFTGPPLPNVVIDTLGGLVGVEGPPCVTAVCEGRAAFLAAVFVDASEPTNPAPAPYVSNLTAVSIDGLALRQMFFVGDGLGGATAGTGALQQFHVPDGATRLYLGFLDAYGPQIGSYADNLGQLQATVTIAP